MQGLDRDAPLGLEVLALEHRAGAAAAEPAADQVAPVDDTCEQKVVHVRYHRGPNRALLEKIIHDASARQCDFTDGERAHLRTPARLLRSRSATVVDCRAQYADRELR